MKGDEQQSELDGGGAELRTEAYLRLLGEHERWLATYVHSLVSVDADAEEILQDCRVALWRQFSGFKEGTNFRAWARVIALHRVLNFRRSCKRRPCVAMETEFIEAVAEEIDRRSEELEQKAQLLQGCVERLPEAHRAALAWRYEEGLGVEEIASRSRRSVEAVYRLLSRIRAALVECVQHARREDSRR